MRDPEDHACDHPDKMISANYTKTFDMTAQLLYFAHGRRASDQAKHISLALDALRVTGEDILLIAVWLIGLNRGLWLPPQAP